MHRHVTWACLIAAAALISACGGPGNARSSNSPPPPPSGGSATVSVGGHKNTVDTDVTCEPTTDGALQLTAADNGTKVWSGITVVVTTPDPPVVQRIEVVIPDDSGNAVAHLLHVNAQSGNATATRNGKKYTVNGHATETQAPQSELIPFDIEFTCP